VQGSVQARAALIPNHISQYIKDIAMFRKRHQIPGTSAERYTSDSSRTGIST